MILTSNSYAHYPFILGYDFYYFWSAGRLILSGQNFYDSNLLRDQLLQIGWPVDSVVPGLPYLPTVSWLYAVFALLPFKLALPLWLTISSFVIFFSSWRFISITKSVLKERATFNVNDALWATLCFPWMIPNLIWGQTNCLVLLSTVLFLESYLRGRTFLSGVVLSLAIVKPHLAFLFILAAVIRFIRERKFSAIYGLIFGTLLQLLGSAAIYPEGFSFYIKFAPQIIGTMTDIPGASFGQTCSYYLRIPWVGYLMSVIGCAAATYIATFKQLDWIRLSFIAIALSLLLAPYNWSHGFIVLLPWYLDYLPNRFGSKLSAKQKYLMTGVACVGVVVTLQTYLEPVMSLVPLLVSASLAIWLQRRIRNEHP